MTAIASVGILWTTDRSLAQYVDVLTYRLTYLRVDYARNGPPETVMHKTIPYMTTTDRPTDRRNELAS